MKKTWFLRVLVLVALILPVIVAVVAPMTAMAKAENNDLVRLTVENRNGKTIFLRLEGPAFYYLTIQGKETRTFTVQRGEYDFTAYGCGTRGKGVLDMSSQKHLIMPVCGANAGRAAGEANNVDLSKQLKVVKFSLENKTTGKVLAILTGPSTYVFTARKDEIKKYTIAPGSYAVKYYACGKVATIQVVVYPGTNLVLRCPK